MCVSCPPVGFKPSNSYDAGHLFCLWRTCSAQRRVTLQLLRTTVEIVLAWFGTVHGTQYYVRVFDLRSGQVCCHLTRLQMTKKLQP